jgi:hypothetical protein
VYYLEFPLFLMNVIIFIISVLKLLSMHGKYIFLAFVVILGIFTPVAGSLTKISANAPVFIGEQNLDISSALQACHSIAWWANGTDMTAPPSKNITIIKSIDDFNNAFHYSVAPELFSGYTGTWYCEDTKPYRTVFDVANPQLSIRVWDLDTNADVTGTQVPQTANITYRIDTNLDQALQVRYRPNINPLDSFFTVTLTDPRGKGIANIYTGSYGNAATQIIGFDNAPYIFASPYYWKNGIAWNRQSRNVQGEFIYPPGTYTFTVTQNLNHMQDVYGNSVLGTIVPQTNATATVTFIKPESVPVQTVSGQEQVSLVTVTESMPVTPSATPAVDTPVSLKTTYTPLPLWVLFAGLGIAAAYTARQRR